MYALRDSWSNHDVYSEPVWLPAYILGWIDIAQQVPKFLKKAYENQISWKWHVQIPYSFWDRRFPLQDYQQLGTEKRKADIQKYMDDIERNLTGVENGIPVIIFTCLIPVFLTVIGQCGLNCILDMI